jgi:hypothetical protein
MTGRDLGRCHSIFIVHAYCDVYPPWNMYFVTAIP